MSSAYLTRLPLVAGGVLAAQAGRAGIWLLSRYFRAPGTNTAILALTTVTAMAASNALYSQSMPHPAPLFGAPAAVSSPATAPAAVEPETRRVPAKLVQTTTVIRPTTAASEAVAPAPSAKVGNAQMAEVQQKLKDMNLFSGTVDGYYGPKTAAAIRAFEERAGMKPMGAAVPEVVSAILRAPVESSVRLGTSAPAADQVETATTPATRSTSSLPSIGASDDIDATDLPPPAPLMPPRRSDAAPVELQPAKVKPAAAVEGAPDLFNSLANRAANAFDAIADMVGDVAGQRQPMPRALTPETKEIAYRPAATVETPLSTGPAETNRDLVSKVQRGLASLGFLAGKIDGVAGTATAKAIRNFEVYYSYDVTGRVSPELLRLLVDAGATI